MNFKTTVEVPFELLKAFVREAKREAFAATDTKTTLPDQTTVYSYRPFAEPRFRGMIYADTYGGNTIEAGQETVTLDLVLRWRNEYYGGTRARFWDLMAGRSAFSTFDDTLINVGAEYPQIVTAFLKNALLNAPDEFPVRGPCEFRASEVTFEGRTYKADWIYRNRWEPVPLYEIADPFAAFIGRELILMNGVEVYWHGYQGGLVRDKYFPFVLS